jgi:hypothetical protein
LFFPFVKIIFQSSNPLIVVFCFPSNLFFYFDFHPYSFNYIVFRFFCVADFFHGFIPLTFDLLGIEFRNFFIYSFSSLITWAMCWKVNVVQHLFFFAFSFAILTFYISFFFTDCFCDYFQFFSRSVSQSHDLDHRFCKLFLNKILF